MAIWGLSGVSLISQTTFIHKSGKRFLILKTMRTQLGQGFPKNEMIELNLDETSSGIYAVSVFNDEIKMTRKVVVQ